ncbi:MAG: QueT transporter family protein [Candidatus Eremiobacteraeota bacterium]|nr:QueT transporter family protein [Candidatus Eremiobacteraeota bacterium]
MDRKTHYIAAASIIAALYAALTFMMEPLSFGPLQCRVSEALAVLPLFTPAAIPGLFTGCLIANLLGPNGMPDIVAGSLFSLLAAAGTWRFRRHPFAALLFPVVINAFGVAAMLHLVAKVPFWLTVISVGLGEAVAVYGIGMIIYTALRKAALFEGKEQQ